MATDKVAEKKGWLRDDKLAPYQERLLSELFTPRRMAEAVLVPGKKTCQNQVKVYVKVCVKVS